VSGRLNPNGDMFREIAKEMLENNPGRRSVAARIQDLMDLQEILKPPAPWHTRLRRAFGGWLVRLGERISQ
jgi:hypothetical protein